MRGNVIIILFILLVFITIDIYAFQGVKVLLNNSSALTKRLIFSIYWILSGLVICSVMLFFVSPELGKSLRTGALVLFCLNYFPKLFMAIFVLLDDIQRGILWMGKKIYGILGEGTPMPGENISRSEFLLKAGVVAATVPLVSISYGILKGAHDYRIKKIKLPLKNLPSAFHGFTIAQISDIHSGSFYNKTAVKGGVDMLLAQKPDVVFFTGDLVNERATELKDYFDVFEKVKAPLGVFSILGNHDYGDYVQWPSIEAKKNNLNNLIKAEKMMGWDLLLDENRLLKVNGEQIAFIGVQNWGAGARWPKYGNLDKAVKGTEEMPVKLLLSHDPSHWDAKVRPEHKDIDVMFAGHTHGCQFGVEAGPIKWSPAQYFYEQWAGLYEQDSQRIYVNRGYGFIGFPGRIGMPPEITIFELVKG
jgi:predicted MPP superfamily phosphohydrolase